MIDWAKYWISNAAIVNRVLSNTQLDFEEGHSTSTGEIKAYPKKTKWNNWEFEVKSPTWLEIRGSLHKYWNSGTNENDFIFRNLFDAVVGICEFLQVKPGDLTVHNLEFGVNIQPEINASKIIREAICFRNRVAINPYDNETAYFTEYMTNEYYFKVYDKGLQARKLWKKEAGNVLRIEIKARNSRFLQFAGIVTMADLLNQTNLLLLGRKLSNTLNTLVFDDDTININDLSIPDRKVYQLLSNPREWAKHRKGKTTTIRAKENRFRAIVAKYGKNKHRASLGKLLRRKCMELTYCSLGLKKEINNYLKKINH